MTNTTLSPADRLRARVLPAGFLKAACGCLYLASGPHVRLLSRCDCGAHEDELELTEAPKLDTEARMVLEPLHPDREAELLQELAELIRDGYAGRQVAAGLRMIARGDA
jgi:hypothetical protein